LGSRYNARRGGHVLILDVLGCRCALENIKLIIRDIVKISDCDSEVLGQDLFLYGLSVV
jgi:hypothetical protein